MSERKIVLNSIESARDFVRAANMCDFDIDLYDDRFILSAKSFLGVLSLDLRDILTVRVHGEDSKFNAVLNKYAVNL